MSARSTATPGSSTDAPYGDMAANSMAPRSASELVYDSSPKFRQLPCRTFISVGTCPYRERCVYLHDPRIICREAKTKTRRKNKEDSVVDALFWPIMPYNLVAAKQDNNRQPHVIQPYTVPPPQNDQYLRHDQAVYSMWMHFVDLCAACATSEGPSQGDNAACYLAPDTATNAYTQEKRLAVFRALSNSKGRSLVSDDSSSIPSVAVPNNKGRSKSPTTVSSILSSPPSHRLPALTARNLSGQAVQTTHSRPFDTQSLDSDESLTDSQHSADQEKQQQKMQEYSACFGTLTSRSVLFA